MSDSPRCARCGMRAHELAEYRDQVVIEASEADRPIPEGDELHQAADAYVRTDEGTYDPVSNLFVCTPCYIAVGMPVSPNRWTVADALRGPAEKRAGWWSETRPLAHQETGE